MGINFLYDEYKKDPSKIEKLLQTTVEISEKLDSSKFSFKVDNKGAFTYYKNRDAYITKIDRTLAKYYEKAINHFDTLPIEKVIQIPTNWKFCMDYFPNLQPVTISYDRLPLNGLVLTSIQVKDPNDKNIDIITDRKTLNKWADIIEVEKPPIMFEGVLSDVQINKILDFLNTPFDDLLKKFKTENFTLYILTILNPSLKTTFLNNSVEKDIDGIIFRFDGEEAMRISSPEISTNKKNRKSSRPSDIYNLTLIIIQEFMVSLDFKKIILQKETFEDRYIEFICKCFNIFTETNYYKNNFTDDLDFNLPSFLTREEASINFRFIDNQQTLSILNKSNTNRELFKIFLASMCSHKRKVNPIFTRELIKHHNMLVDKIADHINLNLNENFFSFDEFRSIFLCESVSDIEYDNEIFITRPEIIEIEPIIKEKDPNDINIFLNRLFAKEDLQKRKRKKRVCIMKGKFFPFHNGHLSSIKDLYNETKTKVFLFIITPKLKDIGFSENMHSEILDLVIENEKCLEGYKFIEGRTINELISSISDKYMITHFAGSEDQCEDIIIQNNSIETIISTKHLSSRSLIEKIKNENFEEYKKLVPSYLHNFFYKKRTILK